MLRFVFAATFSLLALPAFATCGGPAFLDRLSDAERAAIDARVAETPFASGLAWQATKADQTLVVVGTMHIHDPRLTPLADELRPFVRSAQVLMVEATDVEEAAMQHAITANPDMIFITDGPTLPEQLDEDAWEALSAATAARQIPPFMAAKMQPWYLSLALAIPPCAMPDIVAGRRGLDHLLMEEADSAGVPMVAVEPWSTLLDVLQHGTAAEQLEMLQLGLLAPDMQSEMFVSMLDAYFAEEVATLWEASRTAINYVPGLDPVRGAALFAQTEQLILVDRNRAWMPVITDTMNGKTNAMLAVGAAHLPGQTGVLNLLSQQGWDIAPLR